MLPFLAKHFPDQSRMLGESRVRALVQHAIVRARGYGIVRECDVCQFIALIFVFNGDFDANPNLPSVRAVLDDPRLTDPGMRMKAISAAAHNELRREVNRPVPGQA